MIQFKINSLDFNHYQKFGQVADFPDEANFDSSIVDVVQPIGNSECTCITTCDIADDQESTTYDYDNLFNRIPHTVDGADPRDALSEACKNGLVSQGQYIRHWSSYWTGHKGQFDAFDNVRSTLLLAQCPIACWTQWYWEWSGMKILPLGKNVGSNHMYSIEGWTQMNGEPMLIIEAWLGYKVYMSRSVFNATISKLGCSTAVLSTSVIDAKRQKSVFEFISDIIKNIWIALRDIQSQVKDIPQPTPPMNPQSIDKANELYNLAMSLKGQNLTLDSTIPKEYNCAETMSYLFQKVGYAMPPKGYPGTIALNDWMSNNFVETPTAEFACIVVAITQGQVHGHVGINGHQAILSNDSQSGTLESYWSLPAFIDFYKTQKKLQIKYYRVQ